MTFSVIIPTYNRSLYLSKCFTSLLNQSFKDFEVIVCDDGSTDDTLTIIKEYDSLLNLKYLLIENSGGPAKPRNEAIKISVGKWLCFLDADDYWFNDKLKICLDYIDQADLIYHDMVIENQDGIKKGLYKGRNLDSRDITYDLLTNFNAIATSGLCIKREVFINTGWFNETVDYRFIEDFDYWLRVSKLTSGFKYLPKSLGVYVEHDANSSGNFIAQEKRLEKLYLKYSKNLSSNKKANNAISAFHYQAGCLFEKARNYKQAISHFSKSIHCFNINIKIKSLFKIIKYYALASKSN